MSISKPIDLIVANRMHELADEVSILLESVAPFAPLLADSKGAIEACAYEAASRALLVAIAKHASIEKVFTALKSVGAPCSIDDIREGLTAIKERASA